MKLPRLLLTLLIFLLVLTLIACAGDDIESETNTDSAASATDTESEATPDSPSSTESETSSETVFETDPTPDSTSESAIESMTEIPADSVTETESTLSTETESEINTEQETESMTEIETVFQPDPTRAVPKYDALMENLDTFPLTFTYDGTAYTGFKGFSIESEAYIDLDRGVESVLKLRHPAIPALFILTARVFPAESAYEYVVAIQNDGDTNTAVISDLHYEIRFEGKNATLSGIKGDAGGQNYTPYEHPVDRRAYTDRSISGRPSHGVFPYYNLSYGNGGTFIAIGWPGTWYANYEYDRAQAVTTLTTGQGSVSTYIAPGETLRTPLMAFVEYEGLSKDEQTNAWRHYYLNDVLRKIDGEPIKTYAGIGGMSQGMTTSKIKLMLRAYRANGVYPEVIWMDAGWYTGANGEAVSWPQTGSLDLDYNRFPDGLAEIGADAEKNDMMYLLWFEPENMRLDLQAFLAGQPDFREEWLLGTVGAGSWLEGRLMNLGDPDCRAWIFQKICKVIDTAGVTGYRQDFNNDPANAWQENDQKIPNRTGMTENQYVQGYLALWDALIDKYGIFIDSCASGGGRNDLESMKRGVPLHYSDWFDGNNNDFDMKGKMSQALFGWFPYFKNELYTINSMYEPRMNYAMFSLLKVASPLDKATNWDCLRRAYAEYDQIREYFYDDFYLLTEWKEDADRWDARMFYNPETASGFASVACQAASSSLSNTIKLKGLDPQKTYHITDFDGLLDITATGSDLLEKGITVTVPEKPYCAILLINPAA